MYAVAYDLAVGPLRQVRLTILPHLKLTKINKAGKCPLILRLTFDGVRVNIATGIFLLAHDVLDEQDNVLERAEWDNTKKRVRGNSRLAAKRNEQLELQIANVRTLINLMKANGIMINAVNFRKEYRARPEPEPQPRCFIELCQEQIELHYSAGVKPATRENVEKALRHLRVWHEDKALPLDEFTPELAVHFYSWLLSTQGLMVSSANGVLTNIAGLFKKAAETGIVDIGMNPFRLLKRKKKIKPTRLRLTVTQLTSLRDVALTGKAASARDVYMAQYYLHGSRIGAVLMLRWQDVTEGAIGLQMEKGGGFKRIRIAPPLQQILDRQAPGEPDTLVFPWLPADFHGLGEHERYQAQRRVQAGLSYWLKQAGLAIGIKSGLHSHTARHTLATHAAEKAGIRTAQAMLGHASIQQTQAYIGSMRNDELEAAQDSIYNVPAPNFEPELPNEVRVIPYRLPEDAETKTNEAQKGGAAL